MVVGTVFIMVFGMATVTMVESIDESVKNSEYDLPDPEVNLVSVTDQQLSTGPIAGLSANFVSVNNAGTGYTNGVQCDLAQTGASGASVTIVADGDGELIGFNGMTLVPGMGYSTSTVVTVDCGTSPNSGDLTVSSIHDLEQVTIKNVGSENVELDHIYITLSDTGDGIQGKPFEFTDHYSGGTQFLFPGEEISTDSFPLDLDAHGFEIDDDPDRAYLVVYDHNSAISVTIS